MTGLNAMPRMRASGKKRARADGLPPMPSLKPKQEERDHYWDNRWRMDAKGEWVGQCATCGVETKANELQLDPMHSAFGNPIPDRWRCNSCNGRHHGRPNGQVTDQISMTFISEVRPDGVAGGRMGTENGPGLGGGK